MLSSSSTIHPSAIISPNAQVAADVKVGPFVVIEEDVVVESGSELLAGTILQSGSRIGRNCRLGPYATVAGEPLDNNFKGEKSYAVLEDQVVLRDFATVHRATGEEAETRVGSGSLLMSYTHVSHNGRIGKQATLVGSKLSGHCQIGDYAFISYAFLHQFCRVGAYALLGGQSYAAKDVLPFSIAQGNPSKHYRLNKVGLRRRSIRGERYDLLEKGFRAFRQQDWQQLAELAQASEDVTSMLKFKAESKRGLCGFA